MSNIFEGLDTSSKVRGFIASRGLTQVELGKLLDLTPETITARMKNQTWTVAELKTLAEKYGIEATELL